MGGGQAGGVPAHLRMSVKKNVPHMGSCDYSVIGIIIITIILPPCNNVATCVSNTILILYTICMYSFPLYIYIVLVLTVLYILKVALHFSLDKIKDKHIETG